MSEREDTAAPAPASPRETREHDALKVEMTAELVRKFGAARLRVLGSSMVPALRPGDILTVRRAAPGDISVGQLVVFSAGPQLITHRVAAVAGDPGERRWITRGDRALCDDPAVLPENLIAVVESVSRRAGHGDREVQFAPRARLTWFEKMLLALALRRSDKATSLFLRLTLPARAYRQANEKWSEEAVVWQP
jgi:signal peptidase I